MAALCSCMNVTACYPTDGSQAADELAADGQAANANQLIATCLSLGLA